MPGPADADRGRPPAPPGFAGDDCRLVVTVGSGDEVLAYEFLGRIEDEEYTVYINAKTAGGKDRPRTGAGFKRLPREGPPPGGQ